MLERLPLPSDLITFLGGNTSNMYGNLVVEKKHCRLM
jgi:hypothetical protein